MANVISQGELRSIGSPWAPSNQPAAGLLVSSQWTDALPGAPSVSPLTVWSSQPSVRKVVDFIARAVASTPLKVYRRVSDTDRQRVTDHPLARILATPSPGMIPYRFWHSVIVDWLLYDKWLVLKVANTDENRPVDLVRVQAERVTFGDDGLGRVNVIAIDGVKQPNLLVSEVLLDHGYSPLTADGTSPMRTLGALIQESIEAVDYRRGVWKNSARIPAVLSRPAGSPTWTDEQRDRFYSGWQQFTRNGNRSGGTPILQDGMTLQKVEAFSPKDTMDIEGRQLADAEVSSAFHIAPELVGAREGTYSNVEAFRQMLYRDGLGPMFVAWEQIINTMLVPDYDTSGEIYVEADVDAKLRGSFTEQAAVLSTSTGAPYLTRNEARARQNLPAIDGGDQLITPLNLKVSGEEQADRTPAEIVALVTAATALVRAGFDPEDALSAVGLDPIEHLGYIPITVKPADELDAAPAQLS